MKLNNMYLEQTAKSPLVDFNSYTGELLLSGKSIPENAAAVYENLLKWVLEYVRSPRSTTNLRLNLEYFNTSTAIWLSKIVAALGSIKDKECTLLIHLYFTIEDFDSMEEEDLKDELHPIINMIGNPTISVGIKIYGTDDKGMIVKESLVLL
jgi:hypothetical protein